MTVDALALALPGRAVACGLELQPGLPFEEWAEVGRTLGRMDRAFRWWVGDWLAYGEHEYGEAYAQEMDATGLSYGSLRDCGWAASRFELSRRRDNLSWSHHREVAALEPAEADAWLDKAEENGWTREELRSWVKGTPPPASDEEREAQAVPLLRFCPPEWSAAQIVTAILRVCFPDAETALDVTWGSGCFWDGTAHVQPERTLPGADFRALPYADGVRDVVVFDPPHLADAGEDSVMRQRFGTYLSADLADVIRNGARETYRVARLGVVVKVCDHVHGQRFVREAGWVIDELGEPYEVIYETRGHAMIDPRWGEQLSAYNNGATYLVFRKDGPLHVRRSSRQEAA